MKYDVNNPIFVDKKIVQGYLKYLKLERGYTANTLDAYWKDLEKLFTFFSEEGIAFREATLQQLDLFVGRIREQGESARSAARTLSGVRAFYHFLMLEKEIEVDPTELLENPQIGKHLPQVLSIKEIECILECIDVSKPEGQRDRAIVETLYGCGLRITELCNLKITNLYLDEGYIRVHGKGRKERLVPIGACAIQEIQNWMERRKEIKIVPGEEDYVFVSVTRGRHLSRISLFVFIKEYAKRAGIARNISPHTFRHSFATHLLQGGANLKAIQTMLGHEDIGTTEIYMHLDRTHLREEIINHHPRNIKYREEQSE